MGEGKLTYGIKIDRLWKGSWLLGICLSHNDEETYLYIGLLKWNIIIGKIYKY